MFKQYKDNLTDFLYLTNPDIQVFIDLLIEYTYQGLPKGSFKGYKEEFVKGIIKSFWITGRAVFSFPPSLNEPLLYDPYLLYIIPIPESTNFKIYLKGEDISNNVLFLANRNSPYDYLGVSIIGSNDNIISFKPSAFKTACLNTIELFKN